MAEAGRVRALALWSTVGALVTLLLWWLREDLGEAHKTLAYLLLVLGASSRHGRRVGLALALLAFLAFNFFLLPPYYSLHLDDPLDWTVLLGFLMTAGVAAQLFHRQEGSRLAAEHWAREVERFTALGAESVAAPSAVEAVMVVAQAIRSELPVRLVQLFGTDPAGALQPIARSPEDVESHIDPELMRFVVRERRIVALETDGTTHVAPAGADLAALVADDQVHATVILPLYIRERPVGVLAITHPEGLALDADGAAFAHGLARYAALAIERVRLAGEAERVVALQEADRLKDAFVANVSHDLRTPLTTIRALASEMRGANDERAAIIEEEADRLNRLVTDLLDLSRVRAGALTLDPQVVAAEDVVGAALQRVSGVAGTERIQVRLPSDGSLAVGRLDFVQTLRALGNLLENALSHTSGLVELEVDVGGGDLVFQVLDRGPGIAERDRERIFDAFARGVGVRHAGGAGTGLGLAIARSLAEAQGGSVTHRPRPGGGSSFVLTLPAAAIPPLD